MEVLSGLYGECQKNILRPQTSQQMAYIDIVTLRIRRRCDTSRAAIHSTQVAKVQEVQVITMTIKAGENTDAVAFLPDRTRNCVLVMVQRLIASTVAFQTPTMQTGLIML